MNRMFKKISIIATLVAFAFIGLSASAQVRSTDIVLSIYPEHPSLFQNVEATLSSYATDLNKAYIVWSLNQNKMGGGIGKKSFSFETGDYTSLELTASIETIDGQNIIKTEKINLTEVDLLWEGVDSYVPPFYRGKSLVLSEGTYRVVAIANISSEEGKLNKNNLSYAWEKDNKKLTSQSGWGKSYIEFKTSYLDKNSQVKVEVSDVKGGVMAEKRIILGAYLPKILFYKRDPVFGIKMEQIIEDGYTINKEGEIIVAIPYFVSPKNLNSRDLVLDWYVNGEQVEVEGRRNEIGLKAEKNNRGEANIGVYINNTRALFGEVSKQIKVIY